VFLPDTQLLTARGPVRAGALASGEKILGYTGPPRLAALPVARLRTRSHDGPVILLVTESNFRIRLTPDHPVFVQLKPTKSLYDLFLIKREGLGFVLSMARGQLRDLTESTILYERRRDGLPSVHEKIWIVATHHSLPSALYVEQLLSLRYGLPVFALDPRLRRQGLTEAMLERILAEVDTAGRAARLLKDAWLSEAAPHFQRKLLSARDLMRLHYLDGMFYEGVGARGQPGAGYRHVLRIYPLGDGVRFERDHIRLLTPGGPVTECFDRPEQLRKRLAAHARDVFADPHRRITLPLRRPFFIWPASYVRQGMLVATFDGSGFHEDAIRSTQLVDHAGDVLEVELEGGAQVVASGLLVAGHGQEPDVAPE
jgi:hypothetical protein